MNYKVRAIVGLCVILISFKAWAITIVTEGGGAVSPDLNGEYLLGGQDL